MLTALLIPLTYFIGRIISYYSKEEIKGKNKIFNKIQKTLLILIILYTIYLLGVTELIVIIGFIITAIVFFFLKFENKKVLDYLLLGLIIGYLFNNYYLILLVCAYFYFKSNNDYLKKEKISNSLFQNSTFIITYLIAYFLSDPLTAIISSGVLVSLIRKW